MSLSKRFMIGTDPERRIPVVGTSDSCVDMRAAQYSYLLFWTLEGAAAGAASAPAATAAAGAVEDEAGDDATAVGAGACLR